MIVGCSTNSQSCWKWVDRDPPWKTDAQSRPTGTKGCHQFLLDDDETDDIKPFVNIQDAKTLILVVVYWSVLRAGSWRFSLSLQNQVLGVSYIFETMLRKVLRCGANSSDEFVLAVKFQLAYSIIRFAPTSHSFIARFGQFEILVRIALWIHFPCHIVDHICEAKGFPPQIFDFWKTKGFERANICPICSNTSNTNSDTCFQTKFQSNFIWNYSPFIGLLSPDHPSLSLLLSLSLYHLAKLTFTFLLFKTLCSVALAYLQSFFSAKKRVILSFQM